MNRPMNDDPEMDTSTEFVVTYPNGAERVLWGEAAAVNEMANYPGATTETRDAYNKRRAAEAKKAAKSSE